MSSLTFKMMAGSLPPPPVTGLNGSKANGPAAVSVKRPTQPLQVGFKELEKLETPEKTSMNVSRRDLALFLTAASFSAVTLSSPKPAEALMSRSEMKKMILEKFKILREKVGLSKPETEEETKKKETPPAAPTPPTAKKEVPASPATPPVAEKGTTAVPPEPPLPNLQNDKKVVAEASILP